MLAVQALGSRLSEIAQQNGFTAETLVDHFENDPTLFVNKAGSLYYADPALPSSSISGPLAAGGTANVAPYPLADTFKLHSNPGCTKIIYLDFDGHMTPAGSGWNDGQQIVSDAVRYGWESGDFQRCGKRR